MDENIPLHRIGIRRKNGPLESPLREANITVYKALTTPTLYDGDLMSILQTTCSATVSTSLQKSPKKKIAGGAEVITSPEAIERMKAAENNKKKKAPARKRLLEGTKAKRAKKQMPIRRSLSSDIELELPDSSGGRGFHR